MEKGGFIRILLVDDHPVVREGIKQLLCREEDILVVGEAGGGAQALKLVRELGPDVVVLDMQLPGATGVSVAKKILEYDPAAQILVLSAHSDKTFIKSTVELGVAGYLTKDEVTETLIDAVRGVGRGERGWMSRRAAAHMTDIIHNFKLYSHNPLTSRERQILKAVIEGKTNQAIGFSLGINESTVEKHLENIFKKLEVASRVEAAILAIRQDLVEERKD